MMPGTTKDEVIAELVAMHCRLRAIASRMEIAEIPREAACSALLDQAGSAALLAAFRLDIDAARKAADPGKLADETARIMYALAGINQDETK